MIHARHRTWHDDDAGRRLPATAFPPAVVLKDEEKMNAAGKLKEAEKLAELNLQSTNRSEERSSLNPTCSRAEFISLRKNTQYIL